MALVCQWHSVMRERAIKKTNNDRIKQKPNTVQDYRCQCRFDVFKKSISILCCCLPAAQCGLQQGGDPHAEEDGPYELTGGPLIKADAHRFNEEEWHRNSSTETCQVVLERQEASESECIYACVSRDLARFYCQNCKPPQ